MDMRKAALLSSCLFSGLCLLAGTVARVDIDGMINGEAAVSMSVGVCDPGVTGELSDWLKADKEKRLSFSLPGMAEGLLHLHPKK